MKLALVGYGKMGRAVEALASQRGDEISARISSAHPLSGRDDLSGADVAIEFTSAHAAPQNLLMLAAAKIPVVTGSTGWTEHFDAVSKAFIANESALVYGPNFSIGVAIFTRVAAYAAHLLESEAAYGAWGWEIHHDAKKDAPSGTLLHVKSAMQVAGFTRPIDLASNRAGRHPGLHEFGFDSASDTITLRHSARNRDGFAEGALRSARWIFGRRGVFRFEDVLFGAEGPQ